MYTTDQVNPQDEGGFININNGIPGILEYVIDIQDVCHQLRRRLNELSSSNATEFDDLYSLLRNAEQSLADLRRCFEASISQTRTDILGLIDGVNLRIDSLETNDNRVLERLEAIQTSVDYRWYKAFWSWLKGKF